MTVPTQATSADHLTELRQQLAAVQTRVNHLEEASASKRRWWRKLLQGTTAVAVIGVLLTSYGYWRDYAAERRAARAELSELVQRLTAIPVESARLYAENPAGAFDLSSHLVIEARVLTDRAIDVIAQLDGAASAAEYYAISNAQKFAALPDEAIKTADAGLARATENDPTRLELLRHAALLAWGNGDPARGQRLLEEARAQYPQPYNAFNTERVWTAVAVANGDCSAALQHADAARAEATRVDRLTFNPTWLAGVIDGIVATCAGPPVLGVGGG